MTVIDTDNATKDITIQVHNKATGADKFIEVVLIDAATDVATATTVTDLLDSITLA
ncbi:hypothetical protein MNB_SUP05-SYMBIONT-7-245 [hydrothermal vent metagenome]|uniref:Uncharacterized protein n=1 Tax=hydrothermal vent metagenome TaxID=652676 RepID=A0A1W1E691_9ZZZZ